LADAAVLSRGLSEGRRRTARIAVGEDPSFQTNLTTNFIPWPLDSRDGEMAVCVALQSSPTKETVATVPMELLTPRQVSALQLVEGSAAASWIRERWPGLSTVLDDMIGAPEPIPWDGIRGTDLVARALQLAGRARAAFAVPECYGRLPLVPRTTSLVEMATRKASSRLPFSLERTLKKIDALSIPVGGRGGEDAPDCGAPQMMETDSGMTRGGVGTGIPYPEWDDVIGDYRHDFVTVHESRLRPQKNGRPNELRRTAQDLDAYFAAPLDRHWSGRLFDGCDIDIDAVVDSRMDALVGGTLSERLYRDRIRIDRDVACAILIDASGSLAQADLLAHEVACADALIDAMTRSGETFAVFSFSGDSRHHVAVQVLHDFGDIGGFRPSDGRLKPNGYTRLGAAIRHVTARLQRTPALRRVMLVLSDGVPCDEGYEGPYGYADVAKALVEAEEADIALMILGVGESDTDAPIPPAVRDKTRQVARLDDLAPVLGEVHAQLVA
jgi:nitric oxide reductase NorD protein